MYDKANINGTIISITKDDLTMMDVEAIVFYANKDLSLGSGYGNAISTRGGPSIKKELDAMIKPGISDVVISSAGNLKAEYILHAVGPAFQEIDVEVKLRKAIDNAFLKAEDKGIKFIAFPIMGTGFYGVSPDVSIDIMFESVKNYLQKKSKIKEIIFCGNDNREYRLLEKKLDIMKRRRHDKITGK